MLRELSFDDHADVCGTELLAPVFLAIAEENDDNEIQGMRKKALSIENLCGIIDEPGNDCDFTLFLLLNRMKELYKGGYYHYDTM